jgi:uncharacterized protein (TIGR03435 family)
MAADATPGFEVATIKPSNPNDKNDGFRIKGRHFEIENQTVGKLLLFAYGVHQRQLVDGPDWIGTERFDIDGVPDVEGEPSLKQMQGMVVKLLAERFQVKLHREKRDLSVYAITVGKGGAKMAKSAGDPNGLPDANAEGHGGVLAMKFTNISMADFALLLQFYLDRPVVDQTALAGKFDFKLEYTVDESRATDANAAPGIFTAIQEELGLKLEAVKAPVDVMVIDKIERPSAN